MLSHKKLYPFQSLTSNSMHPFVLMQTGFSVNFILHSSFSLYHGLLSASCDSFSLPVLFWGFFPLSDCRKFFLLEKRPKVRIFLRFGGDSPKTHIFPFTEDFQSSLPTTLGNDQMRQWLPGMSSPANWSRTFAAGWPCQVSFQLVLDTKEHALVLHPLNIASYLSNTGTKLM